MKLSQILGQILTDVALRQHYPKTGVCALVAVLSSDDEDVYGAFLAARSTCTQTGSRAFPVLGPSMGGRIREYEVAERDGTMWRGEYGMNRRKLVRDCWRWAKERGL